MNTYYIDSKKYQEYLAKTISINYQRYNDVQAYIAQGKDLNYVRCFTPITIEEVIRQEEG